MAPMPQKAVKAVQAMKSFGFSSKRVKTVLRELLKLYDNNWAYIEDDNYSVLVDALLGQPGPEEEPKKKKIDEEDVGSKRKEVLVGEEPEPYKKRLRTREDGGHLPPIDTSEETSLKTPKIEADAPPMSHLEQTRAELSPSLRNHSGRTTGQALGEASLGPSTREERIAVASPHVTPGSDTTQCNSLQPYHKETRATTRALEISPVQPESSSLVKYKRLKRTAHEKVGSARCLKEPKPEPDTEGLQSNGMANCYAEPVRPKDGPCDSPIFEAPIAMICPPHPIPYGNRVDQDQAVQDDSLRNASSLCASVTKSRNAQNEHRESRQGSPPGVACDKGTTSELFNVQEASATSVDVASSASGEVKLLLMSDRPDFCMPNLDAVFKMVEDRCLKSYRILQPNFSFMNLMQEMCQCVLELGSQSTHDQQDNLVRITPALESLKKSGARNILDGMHASSSSVLPNLAAPGGSRVITENRLSQSKNGCGSDPNGRSMQRESPEASDGSLVPSQQPQLALSDLRPLHDVEDISKGEESVRISVVNDYSGEKYPTSFHYIPRNIVYQNAYVNFALARIGDEDCCSDCFGDCLSAPLPCACARETGGEYAYTTDGLLKKEFLDECVSMNHDPEKHPHFYCKDCPLERFKNEAFPEPCKGHLVRKFVKECWSKCGCNKRCGNRVVQRGITCNLQVFFTSEGKGWGLRTLDELPKGAFVCEYVGEVLTNMELYNRTMQTTGNSKHTYPVLLDADWGSENVLKDEEALCLDATFYGNAARFINHRCVDANLVEVPVEVETPDRHYYHLAFFTTKKIEAFEELTWDYGIDFDDDNHPIQAFRCRCKSKYCRDRKRNRSRGKALVLKQSNKTC